MNNITNFVELSIIDINHEGQGVAKLDNFVYFVNEAVTGDKVIARIVELKKNFAICSIEKIIEKSIYRVDKKCEYFPKCGGCQILGFDYQEQLKYKCNRVINDFKKARINLENVQVNNTLGMDKPFRYRNKTAFSVCKNRGKVQIGTYESNSHNLIDIDTCVLQDEICDKVVLATKQIFNKYNVNTYDKVLNKGNVRHIVIRQNRDKEIMLIIVTNNKELENSKKIVEEIIKLVPQIKTVVQNINSKSTSKILGYKNKILYGAGTLVDYIDDLKFIISPHTFFQVNPNQTEKLYETAIDYAEISKDDVCFDLYCGIGTISLMAARKAKKVIGVEIVEQSIQDAKKNAINNNISNTEFFTGKVEEVLPKLYKKNIRPNIIIVDPPRKGCEKEVLKTISDINPEKIVYVSCNPATLARDVKLLVDSGYILKKIQPVDMFGHSTHVETVVRLCRQNH
ncbi:23S rRNA (uracil(1939)-C(5))-methyltransferase RlmD [Sedimentibacter sp. zth1]|uniref:23S rRNA (uracil(1939)-C(5))-methyltransferase RlmD n=1 Tax=Sedimentibacter sp. zth1 TaxID=2816908 RepID=UPI001A9318A2|nr:23S rRNA (uracil(1939)-C(5))-methyltransferase RlmD [Sedimentibacter sp. zth1]QSX04885.1 23S rRNA (uracil(1939)-C(5))-methyltransferase RlmD [Sedimentibacter sp. zth1]